jgi:tetratricopeptide (TPR) repeat protein
MPVKERKKYLAISRSASAFEEQEAQREIVDWINNMKSSSISNTEEEKFNTIIGMLSKTQQAKLLKAKEMLSAGELTHFQLKNRSGIIIFYNFHSIPSYSTLFEENERRKGNECFKSRELDSAVNHYTNSISLNFTSDLSWTNRAFVYIKKECYDLAEMDCNVAIFLNEKNIKAYYRRGVARMSLGKYKMVIEFSRYSI